MQLTILNDRAGFVYCSLVAIVDRSDGQSPGFDVLFAALLEITLPIHEPDTCPLCAQGLVVIKPGSRPVVA